MMENRYEQEDHIEIDQLSHRESVMNVVYHLLLVKMEMVV